MPVDFLRHVVNPVINDHVGRELTPKIANELKKLIASMESKYGFDAFSGNPLNLVRFLESEDFAEVVSTFKSFNAENILIEVLEEARKAYENLPEVTSALERALSRLKTTGVQVESKVSLEDLTSRIKRVVGEERVSVVKSTIKAQLDDSLEVRIRVLKNGLKIEFKINTLSRHDLAIGFKKVVAFAEQISSI